MLYDYNRNDNICLTHVKSFFLSPYFQIVNCIDKSTKKISLAKEKYGCKINYFNLFTKDIPKTDIYVLCASTKVNRKLFFEILSYSKKAFFLIEKPAWKNKIDSQNCFINYFRKAIPRIKKIKNQFDLGVFGSIQSINCYYTKGLKNNGSHIIDLIFYFFGYDIKKNSIKILDSFNDFDSSDKTVSFSFKLNHKENLIPVNLTGLNEKMFSIIELDIITQSHRIKISEFGEIIEIYSVVDDPLYPNYKILKKRKTQKSKISKSGIFLTKELYKIINSKTLNYSSFQNENKIQDLINMINSRTK